MDRKEQSREIAFFTLALRSLHPRLAKPRPLSLAPEATAPELMFH
jgi:hypothetical protein